LIPPKKKIKFIELLDEGGELYNYEEQCYGSGFSFAAPDAGEMHVMSGRNKAY
jgi:hypothetical protein